MSERITIPVIAGLIVGIAFVVIFSMLATTFQEQSTNKSSQIIIPKGSFIADSERNNFEPETITVAIGANNTVTWINKDSVPVGIRATDMSDPDFFKATQDNFLMPNETFEFTFTKSGNFGYNSVPGPWRQGTVEVLESS